MSEYTRYQVRYEQRSSGQSLAALAGLASAAVIGIGALASSMAEMSSQFEQEVRNLEQSGKLSPLECRMTALASLPLLRAAAEAECGRPLTAGTQALTAELLANATKAGRKRLLVAESALLDRALTETLQELGYRITRRNPVDGGQLIKGDKSNGTSVTMCGSPVHGALEVDLAGFRGQGCLQERQRILDGLRRRGVMLNPLVAQRHESLAGGTLAQRFGDSGLQHRPGAGAKVGGQQ